MRRALIFSVLFHLSVVASALIGLPMFEQERTRLTQPIPVKLVTVAEFTNLPRKPEKTVQPGPEPTAKPKASVPVRTAPKPQADAVPPPKKAAPPKPAEAAPKPAEAAPKPVAKRSARLDGPAPRTKPARQQPFDATRIAALLDKSQPKPTPAQTEDKPEDEPEDEPLAAVLSRSLSTQLTISEVDAIRLQIQKCWIVPAGARYAEDLTVRLRVFLRRDGGLARLPEVVDSVRMTQDMHFRTAAEHAVRAVQKCVPLRNLPADKYDRWRDIELTFDPEEMLGG